MQEVQTAVNITPINTLETIEWIGTSSRRIVIGRQTTQKVSWTSGYSLSIAPSWTGLIWDDSWDLTWEPSITDEQWDLIYKLIDTWVRVPLQWNYQLEIHCWTGSNYTRTITKIKVNWETRYEYNSASYDEHIDTITLTLWKFDLVELTIRIICISWNTSWAHRASYKLQKL